MSDKVHEKDVVMYQGNTTGSGYDKAENSVARIILVIISIKLVFFFLDSLPQFFLGDSQGYICTAIDDWIPPDRSFFYGYIIRFVTFLSHSLTSLVMAQVIASCISCILLAYIFRLMSFPVHYIITGCVAFAVEPLQLFYERYVMTETFSLMFFVLFVFFWTHFLKKPDWLFIFLANVAGIFAVALRLSFLPVIQAGVVFFPLACCFVNFSKNAARFKIITGKILLWLTISLICYFMMHTGYKHLNGYLSGSKPAYNYDSSFFLLASWCPLIQEEYFEDRDLASRLVPSTLRDLSLREYNRWNNDGIVSRLIKTQPDRLTAERIAGQVAKKIFINNPWGVIRMGLMTYGALWFEDSAHGSMKYDRGERELPEELLNDLSDHYNLDGRKLPFLKTLTNTYYFAARLWYRVLLISPLILFIAFWVSGNELRPFIMFSFIAGSLIILIATMVATMPVVRYLHPLSWLVMPGLIVIAREVIKRIRPVSFSRNLS